MFGDGAVLVAATRVTELLPDAPFKEALAALTADHSVVPTCENTTNELSPVCPDSLHDRNMAHYSG